VLKIIFVVAYVLTADDIHVPCMTIGVRFPAEDFASRGHQFRHATGVQLMVSEVDLQVKQPDIGADLSPTSSVKIMSSRNTTLMAC